MKPSTKRPLICSVSPDLLFGLMVRKALHPDSRGLRRFLDIPFIEWLSAFPGQQPH
jgi:hypothetical protein